MEKGERNYQRGSLVKFFELNEDCIEDLNKLCMVKKRTKRERERERERKKKENTRLKITHTKIKDLRVTKS